MPIMESDAWKAWSKRSQDEMDAEFALRDLIVISNFVDHQGRTMRPEAAVRLLQAAGKPSSIPLKLMLADF